MKKLVVALAALALGAPAFAQDASRSQLGIGVSITPLEGAGRFVAPIEVYVPFRIAPNLRLEPSIGILTNDQPSGSAQPDTSDLTLGVGLFAMQRAAQNVDMYFGGRLKLNFSSTDPGDSGTDFILAGAIGGEAFIAPKFSLGMEAQLGFYSRSDATFDDSGFFTTGMGFLRLYF